MFRAPEKYLLLKACSLLFNSHGYPSMTITWQVSRSSWGLSWSSPLQWLSMSCIVLLSYIEQWKNTLPNCWAHFPGDFISMCMVCSPNYPSETEKLQNKHLTCSSLASVEPLSHNILDTPLDFLHVSFRQCCVHFISNSTMSAYPNTWSLHTNKQHWRLRRLRAQAPSAAELWLRKFLQTCSCHHSEIYNFIESIVS